MTDTIQTGIPTMYDPSHKPSLLNRVAQNLRQMTTLSEALRMIGALIMVASMSVFLLQGWSEGSDVNRYFLLLTQTVLMAVAGLAMSFLLRENKGARVFFNLSLISVVANFTVLGALIYSTVQWDAGLTSYPQFAHWEAQSDQSLSTAMIAAGIVLIPVTLFGFMLTARPVAVQLSLMYLALNSLLLLPFRDSLLAGGTTLLGFVLLPVILKKILNGQQITTKTTHFIKAIMYAPLLIILGRSVMLYAFDSVLLLSVSLSIFLILRTFTMGVDGKRTLVRMAELMAFISTFGIAFAVTELFEWYFSGNVSIPVFCLTLVPLNHELSGRVQNTGLKKAIRLMTGVVLMGGLMLHLAIEDTLSATLLCITAALAMIAYAKFYRDQLLLIPAVFGLIISLLFHSDKAFDFIIGHSWISLAVTGALIIIAASVLERHGVVLKLRFRQWRGKLTG